MGVVRRAVLLGTLALLLSSCRTYRRGPFFPPANSVDVQKPYTLGVVEFDDQGWYHDPEQAREVLANVYREARYNAAIIIVFVHGWHHNAKPCDQNLLCFRKTLERLQEEIGLPYFQAARKRLDRPVNPRVIGIYIGWRGQSLPMPLDYVTFWDRKPAGHRAGGNDLRGFFTRLQALYEDLNAQGHLTGLVTVGHSFGGAVLENALSEEFTRTLALNVPITGATDLSRSGPDPDRGVYEPRNRERPGILEGFGDLVILINPAFEASLYQTLDTLAGRTSYSRCQTPILMTLSAENDKPRKTLFPLGRFFSTRSQAARDPQQQRAISSALGVYAPQQTHILEVESPPAGARLELPGPKSGTAAAESSCTCEADLALTDEERARAAELPAPDLDPRTLQLALPKQPIGTLLLQPKPGKKVDPNLPFLVAETSKFVINGHNRFFDRRLIGFLVRYIGITEAKKLLLARDWYESGGGRRKPKFPCTEAEEYLPSPSAGLPP